MNNNTVFSPFPSTSTTVFTNCSTYCSIYYKPPCYNYETCKLSLAFIFAKETWDINFLNNNNPRTLKL